jgi:hypothetical protein
MSKPDRQILQLSETAGWFRKRNLAGCGGRRACSVTVAQVATCDTKIV